MQALFKSELEDNELEGIKTFCKSVDYCSIEQSIGWNQMLYKTRIRYFYLIDDNVIKSFSQINERFKFAQIIYGPVCCDKDLMIDSINEIINYYKKRGFIYLGIQLYYKSGYETDYIEYLLNNKHKINYFFNNKNTKSSIEIDLQESIDDIYRKIRENHKRNIKKALKSEIKIDILKNAEELMAFSEIYSKMSKARQIEASGLTSDNIKDIYNYLIINNKGQVLLAKDKNDVVLGGIILVYQGISVRYLLGASDPERRDIPILHIVLYEAIIKSKAENFRYFDFWGFNHFASENDQVYQINHFKLGFGGYYTFFAKKMNIDLFPFGTKIFYFLSLVKEYIKRVLNFR
jgi:lipid II:glycine glycyltransferase (peptidoglycan interpeptide bridge formation enzyme)